MLKKIISVCLICMMLITIGNTAIAYPKIEDSRAIEEMLKKEALNNVESEISIQNQMEFEKEINEAYKRVEDEENYIVALINDMQDLVKTDRSNWEFNLVYLKDNYNSLEEKSYDNSNINMIHINSYIEAYEFVSLDKNLPLEKTSSISLFADDSSYSIEDAVDYATTYYSDYNSDEYPDWSTYGGDCANFVSQCLYAGGKQWSGTPGTSEAAQDFSNWFSKGTELNTKNVSSTWRGADAFRHYWKANALAYKTFDSFTSDTYDYGFRGDAVTLLTSTGRGYHTLIIVAYKNGDLTYAAHTNDTKTGSLKGVSNSFIIYRMKYDVN